MLHDEKLVAIGLLSISCFACNSTKETDVLVLSAIHSNHELNKNYSYDDLFATITKYDPEVIGIEIRPEDMEQGNKYLDPFYPAEMMMVKDSFPAKVVGLDFYREQTRGKLLAVDMFKDSAHEMGRIVDLQRKMSADSDLIKRQEEIGLPALQNEQLRMANNYSAAEMISGEYDSITSRYYVLLDSVLTGTAYEDWERFNTNRDVQIRKNALEIVANNKGKKILILVGANHRYRLVDSLRTRGSVRVVEKL